MNTRIIHLLFGTTIALAIAMLLLVLPMPAPTFAINNRGNIGVDIFTDEYNMSGSGTGCSLREAIDLANGGSNTGHCLRIVTFAPYDTVLLPSGTYSLTIAGAGEDLNATGDLDIRASMIISATDATPPVVTANPGYWNDRIFHIITGTVTMKGLIISRGYVSGNGGGVLVESGQSLTLSDSEVRVNFADASLGGGIYNAGTLTLNNVIINQNQAANCNATCGGGGIYNLGTATLTNVTLSSNLATLAFTLSVGAAGGGMYNGGTATLINVTVSGNGADGDGSGIAIHNGGTVLLTNVTLSGNKAWNGSGGGISNLGGTMTLINVTVSDNFAAGSGAGIYNGYTATLTNTIVANNVFAGNCSGSLGGSFNLSSDNTCGFGGGRDNVNVNLAPLGNYGGPTLTYIPYGGPAIDNGTNTGCPSTDQRGLPRPVNVTCDVGSVERQTIDFPFLYLPLILK